ncbi:DUF3761 domain-containing protein [Janthinobacterium lividum]|nr:DUF3761 domain-containing protein [Janthinobacterium lividum]
MKNFIFGIAIVISAAMTGCGGGEVDSGSVKCKDGWISPSKDKQGACSSHGGVA